MHASKVNEGCALSYTYIYRCALQDYQIRKCTEKAKILTHLVPFVYLQHLA
jgi:hypothetical protein